MPANNSFIRNIIIGGNRYIPSRSGFKTSMLRGYLSVLLFLSSFFYWGVDMVHHITENNWVYYLLGLAALSAFILNRKGKTLASNIVLLLTTNFTTFIYAATYRADHSLYIFLLIAGLFAMALFEYKQKIWWMSFASFSFILFLIANYSDFVPLRVNAFTEILIQSNFAINYAFAFGTAILLLFFVMNLNHYSEVSLKENESDLLYTTSELNKSRLRFELAIKGSNAGIWEWNVAANKVYNSPVWKSMLGYDENELNDMNVETFLDMVSPADRQIVQQALNDHLTKRTPYAVEFRMIRKDGKIIWVADSGSAEQDERGAIIQMVGSIIDITERKEAEQKIIHQNELLAKTNAELDRFVYSTSHDLRSPLSSLLGLITIAEKTNDPEEVSACLGMMTERIRTMEIFIKEIIDYSRNTRTEVQREAVRIFPIIHEIVENLRFSEGAENIFVRYNISPELNLQTDENRFKVIMNNLIGNAIKYHDRSRENPFISIEAVQESGCYNIMIEDNGIGIAPEHQHKIFDMFYRASEKSHGSGLGLYIVKETVEKLNGSIDVKSAVGQGTKFLVRFPN